MRVYPTSRRMIVDTTSGLLVTYLVNAVWQVPTITIAAALCSRLMRRVPSEYTHRLWVAALLLGTLLPLLSIGTTFGRSATTLTVAAQPQGDAPSLRPDASTHILSWLQGRSYRQPLFLTPFLTWLLTLLYAASFCYSLARLGWAWRRTTRFRAASCVRPLPDRLAEVVEGCAAAFSCSGVLILCSAETAVPVTMGFGRSVFILPEELVDFSSAISHELAHIRRHDFALNLAYELFSLSISLHPAVAILKDRIGHTRELACDEMASAHLANRTADARSLLHIAQSSSAKPSRSASSCALGLFDTNTLEDAHRQPSQQGQASNQAFENGLDGCCLSTACSYRHCCFRVCVAGHAVKQQGHQLETLCRHLDCAVSGENIRDAHDEGRQKKADGHMYAHREHGRGRSGPTRPRGG